MSKITAGTTANQAIVTSGDTSGNLVFETNGGTTALTLGSDQSATFAGNVTVTGSITSTAGLVSPVTVAGNSTAGAEIRLPEDTDNGTNYVALKAANALAANLTFTLPSADGTNGQYLQTNGSGALSFSSVVQRYELISTATASAASTVDFTGLSNSYSEYILVSRDFVSSASDAMYIRTSTNNGTSYDSGASNYGWTALVVNTAGTVSGNTGAGSGLIVGYTQASPDINYFRAIIVNAGVATKPMIDTTLVFNVGGAYGYQTRTVGWRAANAAINAFRLYMASGTISGTFYLYGVRT